ncbi:MAG: LOG family protein [Planctomycetota bacterium]|nr:LOG family protein [Planctomycetota bacterium]
MDASNSGNATPLQRVVTVFGSNDPREGEAAYETAFAVGHKLAELGCAIANGGYGGTMEASARGAKAGGGTTIGVTCRIWKSKPNRYIDRIIETNAFSERLERLIALGVAGYVVLPGATGTLTELATVWEMMCKRMLPRRPLVCVGAFWQPLIDMMAAARPEAADVAARIEDADELERFFTKAVCM